MDFSPAGGTLPRRPSGPALGDASSGVPAASQRNEALPLAAGLAVVAVLAPAATATLWMVLAGGEDPASAWWTVWAACSFTILLVLVPLGFAFSTGDLSFGPRAAAPAPATVAVSAPPDRRDAAALERIAERMTLATEAAGVGLFEAHDNGRAMWWDPRMHALHGTDPERFEPTVAAWRALIHPDDVDRVIGEAVRAMVGRTLLDTEYRIVRPDGSVRSIRAFARRRDDGAPTLVGTNWDVTAERRALDRLRLANEHISQFAAIASHDLQAPLRQIALWSDLLKRDTGDRLDPEAADLVDRIHRRTRTMRRMVVGLMEFSRAGDEIRLAPLDLNRLATEAVADYARDLADIGASVVVEPLPPALGDPLMMGQIFGNLISNAIKYRSASPLQLVISGDLAPGAVVIQVRDNGIGIDPAYAEAVFQLFRRLPEASSVEGSGIGLAVCQRMADAMGGQITLDTRPAGGSTFVVRLRPVPARDRSGGGIDAAASRIT